MPTSRRVPEAVAEIRTVRGKLDGVGEPLQEALAEIRRTLLDPDRLIRAVASGRRRGGVPPWHRAEARYVDLKIGRVLQVTTYDETRARTRNTVVTDEGAVAKAVDELLDAPFGNWHVDTVGEVMQLRVTKKGDPRLHTTERRTDEPVERVHDREKPRLLPPRDPVLRAVGIADHLGRVKPTRQAKYRQVDEFLRILRPAVDSALTAGTLTAPTTDEPLRVVDLGCGNAYLTFAAASYLAGVCDLPVRMIGVDVRDQARRRNTELAASLEYDRWLSFSAASVAEVELPWRPDVVLALHACDTATDEALARAIGWGAPVVLAAPCCHHDIQTQLDRASVPEPYEMLTRYGILRERFADVLTDALRASLLRQHGYRVEAIQFVESRHTPRNVLLRAIRTGAESPGELRREYDDLVEAWGVRPALARMLDAATTTVEGHVTSSSECTG